MPSMIEEQLERALASLLQLQSEARLNQGASERLAGLIARLEEDLPHVRVGFAYPGDRAMSLLREVQDLEASTNLPSAQYQRLAAAKDALSQIRYRLRKSVP